MASIGDFVLGIPTLTRYDCLERLLRSANTSRSKPREICIVDNGGKCPFGPGDFGLPIRIVRPRYNLGVSESFNTIARMYRPENIIFSNDDIVLRPDSCDLLLERPAALVLGIGWGFALSLHREVVWREAGEYERGIWPAYYEDADFKLRVANAGLTIDGMADAAEHVGSATARSTFATDPSWYGRNRKFYWDKWGMQTEHVPVFRVPWDGACPSPLDWEFAHRCSSHAELSEALRRLRSLAAECDTATVMGTGFAHAAIAVLAAQPDILTCYDAQHRPEADILLHFRGETDVRLVDTDVGDMAREPTDLLFIDLTQVGHRWNELLALHAPNVKQFIVCGGTTATHERNEGDGELRTALVAFLTQLPEWRDLPPALDSFVILRRQ